MDNNSKMAIKMMLTKVNVDGVDLISGVVEDSVPGNLLLRGGNNNTVEIPRGEITAIMGDTVYFTTEGEYHSVAGLVEAAITAQVDNTFPVLFGNEEVVNGKKLFWGTVIKTVDVGVVTVAGKDGANFLVALGDVKLPNAPAALYDRVYFTEAGEVTAIVRPAYKSPARTSAQGSNQLRQQG